MKYYYLRQILGIGLCISRGTASIINFSLLIIFIPMCRATTTSIRSYFTHQLIKSPEHSVKAFSYKSLLLWSKKSFILFSRPICRLLSSLIDFSLKLHITCSYTIILAASIHSIAHVYNAFSSSLNYNNQYRNINIASFPGENPLLIIINTVPGITGISMIFILIIMSIGSLEWIRKRYYQIFISTHRLFFLFIFLIFCHPMGGILKEQINLDEHYPGCNRSNNFLEIIIDDKSIREILKNESILESKLFTIKATLYNNTENKFDKNNFTENFTINDSYNNNNNNNNNNNSNNLIRQKLQLLEPCDDPLFSSLKSNSWKWIGLAIVLYSFDMLIRIYKRKQLITLVESKLHDDDIMELELVGIDDKRMVKKAMPGQFVYIKCPKISIIEWHPFSLTSLPIKDINDTFSLHLTTTGDWTSQLKNIVLNSKYDNKSSSFKIYLDGPFFSSTQDVFTHKIGICIAGGIGATPFASVLSSLSEMSINNSSKRLHTLYFFWICKNVQSFRWFIGLFFSFYQKIILEEKINFMQLQIYFSQENALFFRKWIKNLPPHEQKIIHNLRDAIFFGKPNWYLVLSNLSNNYPKQRIAVFCSGPKLLISDVKKACRQCNIYHGSHLIFKHEDFGS